MAISGISNNVSFRGNGLQKVQKAAGKALYSAMIDGTATRFFIDKAFANEDKISKIPLMFAELAMGGIVGTMKFVVDFAKNLVK